MIQNDCLSEFSLANSTDYVFLGLLQDVLLGKQVEDLVIYQQDPSLLDGAVGLSTRILKSHNILVKFACLLRMASQNSQFYILSLWFQSID